MSQFGKSKSPAAQSAHKKVVNLTLLSMFSAIIIAMTFIPYVGYISLGVTLSITTLHIPVIIGAVFLGPVGGTILGAVWGISCLLYALFNGTADAVIFTNPLISVLPRIIVGFLAAWFYIGFKKLSKNHVFASVAAGILGTLTNTLLVLSAIHFFGGSGLAKFGELFQTIITVAFSLNCALEVTLCAVLVPTITSAIAKIQKNLN